MTLLVNRQIIIIDHLIVCGKNERLKVLRFVLLRMRVWSTVSHECPVWFDASKNKNIECRTNCYIISKSHQKQIGTSHWCGKKFNDSSLDLVLSRMVVWSTVSHECNVWLDASKNKNIECRTNCYIISKSHKNIFENLIDSGKI